MVYLTASLKLYPGKQADFVALLNDIMPLVRKHGWKLVGSYASIVGRLNTAMDLWELPEPNAVASLLADPDFQKFGSRIAAIVEDETLALMTKLPIG